MAERVDYFENPDVSFLCGTLVLTGSDRIERDWGAGKTVVVRDAFRTVIQCPHVSQVTAEDNALLLINVGGVLTRVGFSAISAILEAAIRGENHDEVERASRDEMRGKRDALMGEIVERMAGGGI